MAESQSLATVTVDGIEVQVDTAYIESWEGVLKNARMQSDELSPSEKVIAITEFYAGAVANVDEITREMGGRPFVEVIGVLSKAVLEATPKN